MTDYLTPEEAAARFRRAVPAIQANIEARNALYAACCRLAEQYGIARELWPADLDKMIVAVGATGWRDVQDKAGGYFSRLAMERQGTANPAEPVRDPAQGADDDSAYVFASRLPEWSKRFGTPSALSKFIRKPSQSAIRWKPDGKRRCLVHAADWLRYWGEQDRVNLDALDAESVAETIADIEARKAEEHSRNRGK